MELTAATHHSSPKGGWPDTTHDAPRGQKTASSAFAHPGVLKEPEVLVGAVTVGFVAAPGPLLCTPMLADTAAEAVDARMVQYLLKAVLVLRKEQAAETRMRELALVDHAASLTKRKRKKKRKRKLPRTSSRPRLAYSGYKFLPQSRRLFGTNSTFFLRDGGARAVRTWKPGLSTSHWYLAPTCSVPVTPEEHKKIWSFLGDDYADFFDPLYLTVTCSAFAGGVQDYGLFWKMTSGWIPCPAPVGSTLDTRLRQFTEAFTVQTADNFGQAAVPVLQRRRHFLHGAEAEFHGLAVQQTIVIHQLQFLNEVIDVPGMQVVQVSVVARCVQRQVPWLRFLLINTVVYTLSSRRADPHGPVCSENHRDTPAA